MKRIVALGLVCLLLLAAGCANTQAPSAARNNTDSIVEIAVTGLEPAANEPAQPADTAAPTAEAQATEPLSPLYETLGAPTRYQATLTPGTDKLAITAAGNAFESSIRLEAKKIFSKYVAPPYTTDFAVLYLPTEGLFAEVMRRPGLVEAVQNDCRVMITGPANLAAMLNSLQMGLKTLAIEKRSSEVWSLLGMVKTEFAKFGDVVEATKKSIDAAAKKFDEVGVRTRAIQRKLRDVQELPAPGAAGPLVGGSTPALPGLDPEEDLQ